MPPEQNLQSERYGTTSGHYTGEVMAPTPVPMNDNMIRSINVRQLNHGYIVEVGCQTLAIESSTKVVALLSEYIYNPLATEEKYREGKLI